MPFLFASVLSILFSLIVYHHQQPITPDGVIYLEAAQAYLDHGFLAMVKAYAWPFYPWLIAVFSQLTGASLLLTAYVFNTLCVCALVTAFMAVVNALGGNRTLSYLAMLVILAHPFLNHYRDTVLRGFGYFPCFLWAFWCLFQFVKCHQKRYALGFGALMGIASLFRLEGLLFWLAMPFVTWVLPNRPFLAKLRGFCELNSVLILLTFGMVLYGFFVGYPMEINHSRVTHLPSEFLFGGFFSQTKMDALSHWLGLIESRHVRVVWLAIFVTLLFAEIIKTTSLVYIAFIVFAWFQRIFLGNTEQKRVLLTGLLVNMALLIGYLFHKSFLTQRYVFTLCLLLMVWIPFLLERFYLQLKTSTLRWQRIGIVFLFLAFSYLLIDGLGHFGTSQTYLQQAGMWLNQNTRSDNTLLTNQPIVRWYADRSGYVPKKRFSKAWPHLWRRYDFVALHVLRHEKALLNEIESHAKNAPIQRFKNRKGDQVIIYRSVNPAPETIVDLQDEARTIFHPKGNQYPARKQ